MKELFTINRGALLAALSAVNKSVERRSTIPILLNVLLSFENGALIVIGTDLDAEIRTKVEASGLKAFDGFTLPSSLLHDAVRKLPDRADISFQADDKNDSDKVTVSAGRARFQLNSLPETDFPHMAAGTFTHNMTLPAKELGEAIGLVSFAISAEETRYYLNGIYCHIVDSEIALVATDGHRLALHKMPLPEDLAADMPGVSFRKIIRTISRLILSQSLRRLTVCSLYPTTRAMPVSFSLKQTTLPSPLTIRIKAQRKTKPRLS